MPVTELKVLDYSFLEISDVKELVEKIDYASPPEDTGHVEVTEGEALQRKVKGAAALRLCNNSVSDISGLFMTSSIIVANPVSLRWLDLSFNSITQIPEELANFTDVSVIYLHANSISNFKDLKVLSKFTGLRKLTLHGNPIEDQENYRMFITLLCPTLRMLDFSVITRQDLLSAKFYESAFKQKMKSRR